MNEQLHKIRHSLSHLMAMAVLDMFPDAKLAIGPVIEDGFYYDFDLSRSLTPQDLPRIEKRMKKLIQQNIKFTKLEKSVAEAKALCKNQPYKLELIDQLLKNNEPITFYASGEFIDLCGGPHVDSSKEISADGFKLLKTAGAYWRGDEKNTMLQRIYGVAFTSKKELDDYLKLQEEMKKRDHRKLGKELELYDFHDVAPGAPFWLPKGMVMYRELEDLLRNELRADEYEEIKTPQILHKQLWEESGHWDHYRDNMFLVEVENQTFSLKPMNCPGSTFVYRRHKRSYRDLPIRLAEFGLNSRNELSGTLGGLFRVRQFVMDDAHIYCRPDQIQSEVRKTLSLMKRVHKHFGFNPSYYLSTMPDDHLGEEKTWRYAETMLTQALAKNKISFEVKEKDGAFYGPKIDVEIKDSLNRNWQLTTIQLDYNLPERFDLSYTDAHGKEQRPIIVHRAIYGSFERFIGILVEHYAGAFPVWLSPIQAAVLTVGKAHSAHAKKLHQQFQEAGIRSELNDGNDTVGYKIRKATKQKIPYMLVIGDKEAKSAKLHVRLRGKKDIKQMSVSAFIKHVTGEITKRK